MHARVAYQYLVSIFFRVKYSSIQTLDMKSLIFGQKSLIIKMTSEFAGQSVVLMVVSGVYRVVCGTQMSGICGLILDSGIYPKHLEQLLSVRYVLYVTFFYLLLLLLLPS